MIVKEGESSEQSEISEDEFLMRATRAYFDSYITPGEYSQIKDMFPWYAQSRISNVSLVLKVLALGPRVTVDETPIVESSKPASISFLGKLFNSLINRGKSSQI